ncbi:MAG: hypothetical protein J6T74_01995 [Clostridia bacterium]|nr:hypothetical protein [Clostridia bacterium]
MFIELIDKKNQNTFGNLKAIKLLSDGDVSEGVELYLDGVTPIVIRKTKCDYKSIEIFGLYKHKWEIKEDEPIVGPINHILYGNVSLFAEDESAITYEQFYKFIKEILTF